MKRTVKAWSQSIKKNQSILLNYPMSEHLNDQPAIPGINVEELANLLKAESVESLQLIDVREPQEIEIAELKGFTNLPLSEYETWSQQIKSQFDPHTETLVLCHHGVRSAQMCYWLITQGFTNVKNIIGGIEAYSLSIDPTIPRY